jgi:hypothetical protein
LRRHRAGETPEQIAQTRSLALSTIYSHLTEAIENGEPINAAKFFTPEEIAAITAAFAEHGAAMLKPIYDSLNGVIGYERLRLFRTAMQRKEPHE